MSGPDDPYPTGDWDAFRAARERFLARVRPEAMQDPPTPVCPDLVPDQWPAPAPEEGAGPEGGGV